jgi:hypothetical protein
MLIPFLILYGIGIFLALAFSPAWLPDTSYRRRLRDWEDRLQYWQLNPDRYEDPGPPPRTIPYLLMTRVPVWPIWVLRAGWQSWQRQRTLDRRYREARLDVQLAQARALLAEHGVDFTP